MYATVKTAIAIIIGGLIFNKGLPGAPILRRKTNASSPKPQNKANTYFNGFIKLTSKIT